MATCLQLSGLILLLAVLARHLAAASSSCNIFRQGYICDVSAAGLVGERTDLGSEIECQQACQMNSNCRQFSWVEYSRNDTGVPKRCFLHETCARQPCISCLFSISGPPLPDFDLSCCPDFESGACQADSLAVLYGVSDQQQCQDACREQRDGSCNFFTYIPAAGVCMLYEECPSKGSCESCLSGPAFPPIDLCREDAAVMNALVFGGHKNTSDLTSIDLVKEAYVCRPNMTTFPVQRRYMEAVLIGQDILVCGGYDGEKINIHRECFLYSKGNGWQESPSMLYRRSLFGLVHVGNGVLACGGQEEVANDQVRALDTCERYFTDAGWGRSSLTLSEPRYDFCMLSLDNKYLVVIGGRNGTGTIRGAVERLDLTNSTAEWEQLRPLPLPVRGHGCTLYEFAGRKGIMVTGGVAAGVGITNVTQFYVLEEGIWETPSMLVINRVHHTMGVVGGTLMAVGGYSGVYLSKIEEFRDKTWQEGKNLNVERTDHTMVSVRADYVDCS